MTAPYLMVSIYHYLLKNPTKKLTSHSAHQLLVSQGYSLTPANVAVSMCNSLESGFLKAQSSPCPCCGKNNIYYSLTDKGRIHANRR